MALNLRKSIARNTITMTVVCFAISIGLGWITGSLQSGLRSLAWPFALALGIGLFSGWRILAGLKSRMLKAIPSSISYIRLDHATEIRGVGIDWTVVDDYAAQLEARGFTLLGKFTPYPLPERMIGVGGCFADAQGTTLVEVQHIQLLPNAIGTPASAGGVHFSILSVPGGAFRATTTDHTPMASNYLLRGERDVIAAYPGTGLLGLLEKHKKLLALLEERTGKAAAAGLDMPRYIYLTRIASEQARSRLKSMSGYQIATLVDAFEANPKTKWSPPVDVLAGLPEQPLSALDDSAAAQGQPPVMHLDSSDMPQAALPATANDERAEAALSDTTLAEPPDSSLQARVESAANWFYWIAGLSLINCVVAAMGSDWGFAIGLGISQILSHLAGSLAKENISIVLTGALWLAAFGSIAFFGACGWLARRPSVIAFGVGIALFALDAGIFLLASDWVGFGFHALALYFLWNGMTAARQSRVPAAA
jgi:hypothetical protein